MCDLLYVSHVCVCVFCVFYFFWGGVEGKIRTVAGASWLRVGRQVGKVCMGGRLPAVAGMPANRTFLELSAGQSDWPEKICVVLLPKKRRRPVSFRHEEKRFSLWTAPCLSIKSGVYRVTYAIFRLPLLIIL